MQLNVRDAAALLHVSTKTIYRWVAEGQIPGYRVSRALRFDRSELLEWALANRIAVDTTPAREVERLAPLPTFADALLAGGIHYRVDGDTRDAALANIVRSLPVSHESAREPLLQALRAREHIASTAFGDGIALAHLRNPLQFHEQRASIALCFLDRPVDWHAPDGAPVHIVFTITGPTVRSVLGLQSLTWFALRDAGFRAAVLAADSRETLFTLAQRVSSNLIHPGSPR